MIMIKRPWPVRGIGFQICQKTKQSYMGLLGHTQRQQGPAQELMFDGIAPSSQQESRTSNLKGIQLYKYAQGHKSISELKVQKYLARLLLNIHIPMLIHQMALAQSHRDTSSVLFSHVTGRYFISSVKVPQYNTPLNEANRMSRSKQKLQFRVIRQPTLRQQETTKVKPYPTQKILDQRN